MVIGTVRPLLAINQPSNRWIGLVFEQCLEYKYKYKHDTYLEWQCMPHIARYGVRMYIILGSKGFGCTRTISILLSENLEIWRNSIATMKETLSVSMDHFM
jgi:hypothetical protein